MARRRPPCPDPDRYTWVNTEDGGYWRKKRGTGKKARLNDSLQRNANSTDAVNKAGKLILAMLKPYSKDLQLGRTFSYLSGMLRKGLNQSGRMDYSFLKDFDLQPGKKLGRLLTGGFMVRETPGFVEVDIPIGMGTLDNTGRLVTHFYFDLVLIEGDARYKKDMRIDSDTSDVYSLEPETSGQCKLRVYPARTPWMVLLKLNSIESPTAYTTEAAISPGNYAMKVVAVG
ncbi:MAG TPA: hypothetical protein VF145_02750 [Chitinophagaceae bacterium]